MANNSQVQPNGSRTGHQNYIHPQDMINFDDFLDTTFYNRTSPRNSRLCKHWSKNGLSSKLKLPLRTQNWLGNIWIFDPVHSISRRGRGSLSTEKFGEFRHSSYIILYKYLHISYFIWQLTQTAMATVWSIRIICEWQDLFVLTGCWVSWLYAWVD